MNGSKAHVETAVAEYRSTGLPSPGLAAVGAVALAVGGIVVAALSFSSPAPLLITLLALLAGMGLFFILGLAAGHIQIGGRVADSDVVNATADALDRGILVTSADGAPVYVNARLTELAGASNAGPSNILERFVGANARGQAALFRLNRAAVRREHASAEVELASAEGGASGTFRIAVAPLAVPGHERDEGVGRLTLWTVDDVTLDRQSAEAARAVLLSRLERLDAAPIGLMSVGGDGAIREINAALAGWLGYTRTAGLKLSDVLPPDGLQLLDGLQADALARPLAVDIELTREDGRLLPARLVLSARDASGGTELAIAVVPSEIDTVAAGAGAPLTLEDRFTRVLQAAPFGIATVGGDGRVGHPNRAFARLLLDPKGGEGEAAIDVLGRDADEETRAALEAGLKHVLSGRGNLSPIEVTVGSDKAHACRVYMHPLAAKSGSGDAAILYVLDATEQKTLEAKFAQSSKMEAVGKLAGGIAHDFNNMLTAILGFTDMLLATHRPTDVAYRDLRNIKSSAERAAGLVGKLLAFSRQQTLVKETLQLGEVLTDLAPLLKRSIGEKIELKMTTGRDLWAVKTDKIQLEQAIINLAVNARDAMPSGGTVVIRSRNVNERETQKLSMLGLTIGEYVLIEVEDSGTGMSPEVLSKIFEPFFTTKGVGKGTGLGLSTVYGIIKQTGGNIFAESTPGKGTTFRIYLPRHHVDEEEARKEKALAAQKSLKPADLTGTGRVLLVEDEDVVRSFAVRALKSRGYEVLEASSGVEALEVMEEVGGAVDIVVSDVVMPEMDGPTLLKELRARQPGIKIIFVSGYPNEAFKQQLDEDEAFSFLPKPFSLPQLAAKVKEVLGR